MLNTDLFRQRAFAQYQRTQEQTVSPGQAVIMLYQGAIRFAARGRAALETGDRALARKSFLRAQEIIAELAGSLNLDGGEIAGNLLRLYDYMLQRLVHANIHQDHEAAAEVEDLLRSLLPAWESAVRQSATGIGRQPAATAAVAPALTVPTGRFASA
jgi:flagellar protein FliS